MVNKYLLLLIYFLLKISIKQFPQSIYFIFQYYLMQLIYIFISFNIYIENTKLPSINLRVEYKNNNIKNNIIISQKGIDEIGTGTAHSLVLPCSFINKFTINDTLKIRNISEGSIDFISNYVKNATNGIISIYKIA